jgi:hypothetical protein
MGFFDKVFEEAGRFIDKTADDDLSMKDAKRGNINSGGWRNILHGGLSSKSTFSSANEARRLQASGDIKGSGRAAEKAVGASVRSNVAAGYGFNAGHQAIFGIEGDDTEAPAAQSLPPVGAGTRSARQDARQRAIDTQKKRFGLSSTVGTTPLGIQGQGAPTGKKRLTGE